VDGATAFPYPPDDPELVAEIATRCRRLSDRFARIADALERNRSRLQAEWEGPAEAACGDELAATAQLARSASRALRSGAPICEAYREALVHARSRTDRLRGDYDDELRRQRLEMTRVATGPPQLQRVRHEDLRWAQQQELGSYHRRYGAILGDLQLQEARRGLQLTACARSVLPGGTSYGAVAEGELALSTLLPLLYAARSNVGRGPGSAPPPGTSPSVVRAWWRLLTDDEKARLLRHQPCSLGNLDGLPAQVRSAANERVLAGILASLEGLDRLDDRQRRLRDNCAAVLREIEIARGATDSHSFEPVAVLLLVFDPYAFGGEGRAAVAVGDVDKADNVAFLVPGLNSNIRHSLRGLLGNAALITSESRRAEPSATTATVAWMGYDAPGLFNVFDDAAAEEGANLLAADVLAVQASRDVAPHLSVIGHSYGSTTTGTALRDHETGVDDAVLVGSPGPNVEDVSELRMAPGHVFVGASSRDPISYLDRFGKDPTHESFGAIRFEAEDVTRNSWRLDLDDHSKYFEPKTESLTNIVEIVLGRYSIVERAAYRGETWLLPDGMTVDPEADREPTVP